MLVNDECPKEHHTPKFAKFTEWLIWGLILNLPHYLKGVGLCLMRIWYMSSSLFVPNTSKYHNPKFPNTTCLWTMDFRKKIIHPNLLSIWVIDLWFNFWICSYYLKSVSSCLNSRRTTCNLTRCIYLPHLDTWIVHLYILVTSKEREIYFYDDDSA